MRSLISLILIGCCIVGWADEVPLQDFARHARFRDAKISPDGEYLAVTAIVEDRTVLALIHLADMKGANIKPLSHEDINQFWWVAPDRVMYTLAIHTGSIANPMSTGELFTVKADGSESTAIFGFRAGGGTAPTPKATHIEPPAVSERASGEFVSALRDDPTHAIIASFNWIEHTLVSDIYPSAYRIDLRDGRKKPLANAPLHGATFVADHHGAIRFAYASASPGSAQQKVYYRKDDDATWEEIDAGARDKGVVPIMFDRSGDSVYAECLGDAGVGGICRWNITTRKIETVWSAKDSSQAELVPTFDGLDAFAIRTSAGKPATVLIDKTAPEAALLVALVKQFPGVDVQIINASTDGHKVVFLTHGDDEPGVFYLYDSSSKKISKLLERRPWIKPQQMARMEPVSFKARDGLLLHGYLTRPLGKEESRNLPLVVFVHGGPFGVWDTWDFDLEAQMLASRGYAVLQVNYRGSGGYGSDFMVAGYRDWGGKMQDDVTDGTRWAIAQGIADSGRVCIYGASYGGYAALEGAAKEPDLYKCAIGYAGVYDLRAWVGHNDLAQSQSGTTFIDEHIGKDDADLWERSPLAHVDRIKAKVMLVVGGADERVPKAQGENMRAALIKSKNEPEWIYERVEGHGFYEEQHVTELYRRLIAFLDKQIGANRSSSGATP
jgi:dipeptidyl aminopeptidase/acylaminoacyl peptidase